jgi:hypothetical protein
MPIQLGVIIVLRVIKEEEKKGAKAFIVAPNYICWVLLTRFSS